MTLAVKILFLTLLSTNAFSSVDTKILSTETAKRLPRVPEFAFIQEQANKLGVKVYLFGGTASAFAHYVRWDLEREAGDMKYQKERFDYDFTNIYRGNQDLDIVVDGTAEQAQVLRSILKEKYPHFIGNKDAWEVRLLRKKMHDKLPLLGDLDFLNQHTDTNSTGMLWLNPNKETMVYKDLFSWNELESQFLRDVAKGEIKFLFSYKHETTERFKDGKNPPIFAAVRYLAKLTQYEVIGTKSDLDIIKKIIRNTDWKEVKKNYYVKHKLEEFGKKILLNAPDSEYAWNLLESTGLRQKLIEIDDNQTHVIESLSWWMNKEPLRSKSISFEIGKRAKEIFIGNVNEDGDIVVAHETSSFQAYENITRSSKGQANAFISRTTVAGEAAMYGDGFYTKIGLEGARGTGLTIRFKLNPNAREGSDFLHKDGYIIIKNKKAISLIQENINLRLIDFFNLLVTNNLTNNDLGLIEKLKRKFSRNSLSDAELEEIKNWFIRLETWNTGVKTVLDIWFNQEEALARPEILDHVADIEFKNKFGIEYLVSKVLHKEKWHFRFDLIEEHINTNLLLDLSILRQILSKDFAIHREDLILKILNRYPDSAEYVLKYILTTSYAKENYSNLANKVINKMTDGKIILEEILADPKWGSRQDWLETVVKKKEKFDRRDLIKNILSKKHWSSQDKLLEDIVESIDYSHDLYLVEKLFKYALSQEHWSHRFDLFLKILKNHDVARDAAIHLFSTKHWSVQSELIDLLIERGNADKELIQHVFSQPHMEVHHEKLFKIIKRSRYEEEVAKYVLSQESWSKHPYILKYLIKNHGADSKIIQYVLDKPFWRNTSDYLHLLLDKNRNEVTRELIIHNLQFHYMDHLDVVKRIADFPGDHHDFNLIIYVLGNEYWADHPELIRNIVKQNPTDGIQHALVTIFEHEYWSKHPDLLLETLSFFNPPRLSSYDRIPGEDHWIHSHPLVKKYLRDKKITLKNIKKAVARKPYLDWKAAYERELRNEFSCKILLKKKSFLQDKALFFKRLISQ